VLEINEGKFHLLERAPGVSVDYIKEKTLGELVVVGEVPEVVF
jgi:3-oxoacid CoA-transferase subunit B